MDPQSHLIYLLLDSNLPTGGFVASSGLESWAKHGFLGQYTSYDKNSTPSSSSSAGGSGKSLSRGVIGGGVSPLIASKRVTEFLDAEVENYAQSTGVYVRRGWEVVDGLLRGGRCRSCGKRRRKGSGDMKSSVREKDIELALEEILALDKIHDSTLLSHVSRRASKAQGVAILTLYTKGLSRPPGYDPPIPLESPDGRDQEGFGGERAEENYGGDGVDEEILSEEEIAAAVVEGYKRNIRKGVTPGHLAVCWGVMTAALGLSLEKSYHLYLFLHTRSLLSAAVRLNLIGPYLSSQLLLHPTRSMIERHTFDADEGDGWPYIGGSCRCQDSLGGGPGFSDEKECFKDNERDGSAGGLRGESREEDLWDWTKEAEKGPATTWPLGEVLIARHDLQHSRIFNS